MIERSWVLGQIADKYGDTTSEIGPFLYRVCDALYALPASELEAAIDELESLLHGLPLLSGETRRPRMWMPAEQYHQYSDVARVRPDLLFRDGWKLNGRVGRIIAKRRGDIIMVFDHDVPGGPDQYRGVVSDFEVDVSHLDTPVTS